MRIYLLKNKVVYNNTQIFIPLQNPLKQHLFSPKTKNLISPKIPNKLDFPVKITLDKTIITDYRVLIIKTIIRLRSKTDKVKVVQDTRYKQKK